jgi:hypothetical protein
MCDDISGSNFGKLVGLFRLIAATLPSARTISY